MKNSIRNALQAVSAHPTTCTYSDVLTVCHYISTCAPSAATEKLYPRLYGICNNKKLHAACVYALDNLMAHIKVFNDRSFIDVHKLVELRTDVEVLRNMYNEVNYHCIPMEIVDITDRRISRYIPVLKVTVQKEIVNKGWQVWFDFHKYTQRYAWWWTRLATFDDCCPRRGRY
jgi:hypothetical protein